MTIFVHLFIRSVFQKVTPVTLNIIFRVVSPPRPQQTHMLGSDHSSKLTPTFTNLNQLGDPTPSNFSATVRT